MSEARPTECGSNDFDADAGGATKKAADDPTRKRLTMSKRYGGSMPRDANHSYIATPTEPAYAGVVLAHDIYGLLPHVRRGADDLTHHGLLVLAPDLYDGRSTTDRQEAQSLMDGLSEAEAQERLTAALDVLSERGCEKLGIVGWSMGGWLALKVAAQYPLHACVVYYAALDPDDKVAIRCPVLAHLAEIDNWEPEDAPEQFFATLERAEVVKYPSTEHSFANADLQRFNADAAEEAWEKTVAYLNKHLIPSNS